MEKNTIGVLGAGTMGRGIAQVIAQAGFEVILVDKNQAIIHDAKKKVEATFDLLVAKQKLSHHEAQKIKERHVYSTQIDDFSACSWVIEAIVEDLNLKKTVFKEIETHVSSQCILATNTSSLSITSIASALNHTERFIGMHFFNPAPRMPLLELIPALQTEQETTLKSQELARQLGKTVVLCQDTPGFIVNRVARPFYGEALRIYEEKIADFQTIDRAMTELGNFKMGPFTLMDYIGNDVNYAVTESVFKAFHYDPRYKPSLTQKRYVEAGFLGRKSGRGYYNYIDNKQMLTDENSTNEHLQYICNRILVMLFNEAIDTLYLQIATREDIDLAMIKGVNYPKGLITWAEEKTFVWILSFLEDLYNKYREDRYRPSPLLVELAHGKKALNK